MSNTKGARQKKKGSKKKPEMEIIFEQMDLNHDQRISVEELVKASRLLGFNPTKKEAKQMIDDCNPSQEGYINKREFMKLFATNQADLDKEREDMILAFKVFDKDNSGKITADEIKAALRIAGEPVDDAEIADMIKAADVDGDGNISIEEFAGVVCYYG